MNINIPQHGYNGTFRTPQDDFEGRIEDTEELCENESDDINEEEYEESTSSNIKIQKSRDTGDVIYNAINNSKIVNKISENPALSNIAIIASVIIIAIMGIGICMIMAGV